MTAETVWRRGWPMTMFQVGSGDGECARATPEAWVNNKTAGIVWLTHEDALASAKVERVEEGSA